MEKLSSTGSTAVGRLLIQQCSETLKKLSLKPGGNSPFIIFDDCDKYCIGHVGWSQNLKFGLDSECTVRIESTFEKAFTSLSRA